jgi:transglutaminase-like putative cysteine protease
MRLKITHTTRYTYETAPVSVMQILRMTPRDSNGQYIYNWSVSLNDNKVMTRARDAFGNVCHHLTDYQPGTELVITASGEVETTETHGVLDLTQDTLDPELFCRMTPLTMPSVDMIKMAQNFYRQEKRNTLRTMHALLNHIHQKIIFDTSASHAATTAQEAFQAKAGVCQDHAHIFIGCCRALGIPSRYVSGYMLRVDGENQQEASHAWAESYIENLGWVGFDPANGISASDHHVRLAHGLDYLGASPLRGTHRGGSSEKMDVEVHIEEMTV